MGDAAWHLLDTVNDEWSAFTRRRSLLNQARRRRLDYRSKVVRNGAAFEIWFLLTNEHKERLTDGR